MGGADIVDMTTYTLIFNFEQVLTEIEDLLATGSHGALGAIDGCVKQLGHHGACLPVHPQRAAGVLEKIR